MTDPTARYSVSLYDPQGQQVARFPFHELPVPGLCFEVKGGPACRWRIDEVSVAVLRDDELPHLVECNVTMAAQFNDAAERWERVG